LQAWLVVFSGKQIIKGGVRWRAAGSGQFEDYKKLVAVFLVP
jgi:hypothetical protein